MAAHWDHFKTAMSFKDDDAVRQEFDEFTHDGCLRFRLFQIFSNRAFELAIGAVIMFNLCVVIFETDAEASNGSSEVFHTINMVLLAIYSVELAAKLYIFRCQFFREYWNCLDFFIVFLDVVFLLFGTWLDEAPSMSFLRTFRLARLLRAFRMASLFPELNLLMKGFFGAVRAIFWGVLMVMLILSVWSILAVKLIHPINERIANRGSYAGCDRCPHAFSSVWNSSLTFFQQVVAGDSWGTVSLPVIEEEWWAAFFFLAVLVSVSLAMLNLILAVICEAATEARQQSLSDLAQQRVEQMQEHRQKILEFCGEMDGDKSGNLSFSELMSGWDTAPEFADTLTAMDIKKEDMQMIFSVLDTDNSGDVRYEEFVDQLHMLKTNEVRLILFTVMEIRCKVEERFKLLQQNFDKLSRNVNADAPSPYASVPDAPIPEDIYMMSSQKSSDLRGNRSFLLQTGQCPPPVTGEQPQPVGVGASQQPQARHEGAPLTVEQTEGQPRPASCLASCDFVELEKFIKSNEELVQAVKAIPAMKISLDTFLGNSLAPHDSGYMQKNLQVTQVQGNASKSTTSSLTVHASSRSAYPL